MSRALFNLDKTFEMWLRIWRAQTDQPCSLRWTSDFQKCYGIYIRGKEADRIHRTKLFKNSKSVCSRRDLSFKREKCRPTSCFVHVHMVCGKSCIDIRESRKD